MGTRTTLVIPHVGTALGHLIRVSSIIDKLGPDNDRYIFVLPSIHRKKISQFLPRHFEVIWQDESFSVTSRSGKFDMSAAIAVHDSDIRIAKDVKPHRIIGDPGIRASLVGYKLGIPWVGIMHGCYLPIPKSLVSNNQLGELSIKAWTVANYKIDRLVQYLTSDGIGTWGELRNQGTVIDFQSGDYSQVMRRSIVDNLGFRIYGDRPINGVLFTFSTGLSDKSLKNIGTLKKLKKKFNSVAITRKTSGCDPELDFVGEGITYHSMVGQETTVVCHGGSSTLPLISHAGKIICLPSDIDQLCNSLIVSDKYQHEIIGLDRWNLRLDEENCFKREIDWTSLNNWIETYITTGERDVA